MSAENEHPTDRALSFAHLPDRIEGWRVLSIGSEKVGRDYLTGLGAAEFVELDAPSEEVEVSDFDLAIYSSEVETDAHPLAAYAWLRRALKPEGVLIAGSRVLTDPTRSQYARFIPAAGGRASSWLPGRLAFRWMVEVSGFEVERWLAEAGDGQSESHVYLQAETAERMPALDLDRQPLSRRSSK